jgi:hypothetical protein
MTTRCRCRCHAEALAQAAVAREAVSPGMQSALVNYYLTEAAHDPGADVADVVEAALACSWCLNAHVPALLERRIWGPRIVHRETVPTDSEGDE